jgi:hypothetical protein
MSSSRASTQANQQTTSTDNRIAADNGAIALSGGSTLIQDTLSDDVAIAAIENSTGAAKEITKESLGFAGNVVDTGADVVSQALAAAKDTVSTNARLAENLSTVAISKLEANAADASNRTVENVAKYAAIGAAVIAVAVVLRKK